MVLKQESNSRLVLLDALVEGDEEASVVAVEVDMAVVEEEGEDIVIDLVIVMIATVTVIVQGLYLNLFLSEWG